MHIKSNASSRCIRALLASCAALAVSLGFVAMPASAATTFERVRESGHIRLGYLIDTRPFTYKTEASSADGYSIALCNRIAAAVKQRLGATNLTMDWVPVSFEDSLRDVQQGDIDILCTPVSVTLARRQQVSFSIPVFPGGTRAVLRTDAPTALHDALTDTSAPHVVWRGSPAAKTLSGTSAAVVAGTTTEKWLASRLSSLQIDAKMVRVPDYRTGLQQLRDHKVDLFFGDRALILGAMDGAKSKELVVLDRLFTREPFSLSFALGDQEFSLLIDRTLSQFYATADFRQLYAKWFGEFTETTETFFLWNTPAQ